MAMEPAAISARPAVTMMAGSEMAPLSPAASANGTVRPSAMPMTMSRTISPEVKWRSTWRVCGMAPQSTSGGLRAATNVRHQPRDVERFGVHLEYAADRLPAQIALRYRGRHDRAGDHLRMLVAEMVEDLVAVGARHHQIEQDDLVAVGVDAADGLAAVLRRLHGEAYVLDHSR